MGRPPKNPPKEPKLKTLIEDLGEAGCMMIWKGRTPFFRSGPGTKTAELWQVWAGAVDSTRRSRWLNFDPATTRYPGSIEETEVKMLAILSGDRSEGLIAGDPREIIDETHGDDEGLTRQEAAKLIYDHWRNDHGKLLGDALAELKRVREQRKRLYGTDPDAAAAWLDKIKATIPKNSSVLEIDDTKPRLADPEVRRRLFLKPVLWSSVCRGGYAERPLLRQKLMQDFEGFLDKGEDSIAALQIPVFWIGGRSGDGKSVLLMQLCHLAKQAHPSRPIVLFDEPDTLVDWIETAAPIRDASVDPPLMLAVVDDLHKVTDWDRAQSVLETAATEGAGFAIVTCGPSPERALFVNQSNLDNCFALKNCDTTAFTSHDAEVLADHLGVSFDSDNGPQPTLVERVFLTLSGETSIDNFARSLKQRIDERVMRDDLLKQLTAMAWLDLSLPRSLTSFDEANWLEVLAGETQLHITMSEHGFRFGHPAIARPIFEAITRNELHPSTLTTRIAQVMSQILNLLTSPLEVNRVLRQMMIRVRSVAEIDFNEVLSQIFEGASSARVKAAVTAFLVYQVTTNDEELRQDWCRLARTYRGNLSVDPLHRAFLARNLAFAKNADERDFIAALNFVNDPTFSAHQGAFLIRLCNKRFRERGWLYKSIEPAARWVNDHIEHPAAQQVVVGFLSHYPQDTRLKTAAIEITRKASSPLQLTSAFMTQISKCLENELDAEIRIWLSHFAKHPIGGDVIRALIKKPGAKWNSFALRHLESAQIDDPAWLTSISELLPHLQSKEVTETVLRAAWELVDAPVANRAANTVFARLAERASGLEAEDVVFERLEFLWQDHQLSDLETQREAVTLLGKGWGALAARHESVRVRGRLVFDRLSEIQHEALGGKLSKSRKRHLNAHREAARMIIGSHQHAGLCAQSYLVYYDAFPDDDLSGLIVAKLVFLGAGKDEEVAPELLSRLQQRKEELIAACWAWAEDTTRADKAIRVMCTQALLHARWEDETERVRELIRSFWFPGLQYGADRVLESYLRDPRCSDEALESLLDRSIDRESYDNLRARVVARNVDQIFERLRKDNLSGERRAYLLRLLEIGVSDYQYNSAAAWAALQRHDVWPEEAEAALWRGILRSALFGFTLREEDYRPQFDMWQQLHHDQGCEDIIATAMSYMAMEI